MKTRCPDCQTFFRVTPEQLKARAGKVRCGQCQTVFNALDHLQEEVEPVVTLTPSPVPEPAVAEVAAPMEQTQDSTPEIEAQGTDEGVDILLEPLAANQVDDPPEASEPAPALSEAEAHTLGKATGLILPRETTEIHGYSKWAEGVMTTPFSVPGEKSTRWPFILAASLLVIGLIGQIAFHFRSDLAVSAPFLRPPLEVLSRALGTDIPLPRHPDFVSIEASDLQNDTTNASLLVLNATLRNRAHYEQQYPLLELSLTDTQDATIARRVFTPAEYLSLTQAADKPFAANADIVVRLWLEAKDITAAGYRLYVFYP